MRGIKGIFPLSLRKLFIINKNTVIMKKTTFKPVTKKELYEITLLSANAKSKNVFIFEKGSLSDLFSKEEAEKLRKEFLKNKIQVKQITNHYDLKEFSKNNDFIDTVMLFRYVPKNIFHIKYEILIFDEIVAIYDEKEILIIENSIYAENQRELFLAVWDQGNSPNISFDYKPNHSFYNCLNFFHKKKQIIIWPDADAKESYKNDDLKSLEKYIFDIIEADTDYYSDTSYIIGFIWSYDGDKMIDVWKFNENHVDDRSGPLGNVRVYKNGKICTNMGLASGNTLLVLGYEEKLRRQSKNLKDYLGGPVPKLPLEIMNGKDFFN